MTGCELGEFACRAPQWLEGKLVPVNGPARIAALDPVLPRDCEPARRE